MMLLIALVCAAPVIGSYFTYYVIKPNGGTTSYGTLVEPQRPIPDDLVVTGEDGKPLKLASLRGKWLLVSVDGSACDKACVTKLYFMRQVRATQGPERERVVEVWLRTDAGNVADVIEKAYPDTHKLIADPAALAAWLPVDAGTTPHRSHLRGRSERQSDDAFPERSEPEQDQGRHHEAAEVVEHRLMRRFIAAQGVPRIGTPVAPLAATFIARR